MFSCLVLVFCPNLYQRQTLYGNDVGTDRRTLQGDLVLCLSNSILSFDQKFFPQLSPSCLAREGSEKGLNWIGSLRS